MKNKWLQRIVCLGLLLLLAADSDWSPSGNQIMGLVITHRPDTRRRGSGIIVLMDMPTR